MSDHLIEKYFAQQLNPEELNEFNRKIKEDQAFAQAFQLEKDIMEGLEAKGNQTLRKGLEKIYHEEVVQNKTSHNVSSSTSTNNVQTISNRRWWLVAASVALLGLLAWQFWPKTSPQQLYAEYAQHEFNFVEKGSNDQTLFQAETALKAKKYTAAIPLLDEYLKQQSDAYDVVLAKGIAHLEMNDHEKAILTFKRLQNVNALYKIEGTWYLAMAHLKGGNLSACRTQLQNIPSDSSRYSLAQDLLSRLPSAQ